MSIEIDTLPQTQTTITQKTPEYINQEIERQTEARIHQFKRTSPEEIIQRIAELDSETHAEKVLAVSLASATAAAFLLSLTHKKWTIVSGILSVFLLQQKLKGWSLPLLLIRQQGFRTRSEINLERQALNNLLQDEHYPI